MNYYFLDWIAMAASFLAVYLLGQKNKLGFISFLFANISWVAVGVLAESAGILIGNIGFFALNLRGFLKWNQSQTPRQGCP